MGTNDAPEAAEDGNSASGDEDTTITGQEVPVCLGCGRRAVTEVNPSS